MSLDQRQALRAPTRLELLPLWWAGTCDGRRSARRLSHLGAHVWLVRRARQQAALDTDVSEALHRWVRSLNGPRAGVSSLKSRPSVQDPEPRPPGGQSRNMAQVREERRRRARDHALRVADQERRQMTAALEAQVNGVVEDAATELCHLEAWHSILFATYTRAYLRAYSLATTMHAPEVEWMLQIARPEAVLLTQSVVSTTGDNHAA